MKKDKSKKKDKKDKKSKKAGPKEITFLGAANDFAGATTKLTKSAVLILPNAMALSMAVEDGRRDVITVDGLKVSKSFLRVFLHRLHVAHHGDDKEWSGRGANLKINAQAANFIAKNQEWCHENGIEENGLTKPDEKTKKGKDKKADKAGKAGKAGKADKAGKDKKDKKDKKGKKVKSGFTSEQESTVVKRKAVKVVLDKMALGGDQIDSIIENSFDEDKKTKFSAVLAAIETVCSLSTKEVKKNFLPLVSK